MQQDVPCILSHCTVALFFCLFIMDLYFNLLKKILFPNFYFNNVIFHRFLFICSYFATRCSFHLESVNCCPLFLSLYNGSSFLLRLFILSYLFVLFYFIILQQDVPFILSQCIVALFSCLFIMDLLSSCASQEP